MKRSISHKPMSQAIALSPRQFVGRASLILLILASLSLIVISRTSPNTRAAISAPIADSAAPALELLSHPADAMGKLRNWFANLASIYTQNADLREANSRLMQWQHVAIQLEAENNALRDLLHYTNKEELQFTSAKVISDRGGPFARTALINAGSSHNIADNQPVINGQGLVGRIIETGEHSARILLLTDINSRMPVMTSESRERAIATGNNTETLTLIYMADDSKAKVGEKIVTSGDGDTVPAGLPVGEITEITNGVATIRPYASWHRLDYVSAIHRHSADTINNAPALH
ncbi:MAG: rod shape-determining protein MreC [Alphaproteobacteria bacterium]|nr:rod shape-determining protein MreC [Alphaproteobacteria bacterium]